MKRQRAALLELGVCLLPGLMLLLLLLVKIDAPWQYLHDDNGAWYSAVARSHVTQGLARTKGQDFFVNRADGSLVPYLHHPPLLGLFLAGMFRATGSDSPMLVRSCMAALHLCSFALFCIVCRLLFTNSMLRRAWAAFVFAICPMSSYFGKMPDHEPLALLFLLAGLCATLVYVRTPGDQSRRWLIIGGLAWILVVFSSWHAAMVATGLGCLLLFRKKEQAGAERQAGIVILTTVTVAVTLAGLHILWSAGWHLTESQAASLKHWGSVPTDNTGISFYWSCLRETARHGRRFLADVPWAMAWLWFAGLAIAAARGTPISRVRLVIFGLCLGTVAYIFVFFRATQTHAYQQFYLLPFVALASADILGSLAQRISSRSRPLVVLLVCLLVAGTLHGTVRQLRRIYSKPHPWTVPAVKALESQYL